jgi:hypothetical protein
MGKKQDKKLTNALDFADNPEKMVAELKSRREVADAKKRKAEEKEQEKARKRQKKSEKKKESKDEGSAEETEEAKAERKVGLFRVIFRRDNFYQLLPLSVSKRKRRRKRSARRKRNGLRKRRTRAKSQRRPRKASRQRKASPARNPRAKTASPLPNRKYPKLIVSYLMSGILVWASSSDMQSLISSGDEVPDQAPKIPL